MNISIPKISVKSIPFPSKKTLFQGAALIMLAHSSLAGGSPIALGYSLYMENPVIAFLGLFLGIIPKKQLLFKYVIAFFFYNLMLFFGRNTSKKGLSVGICTAISGLLELAVFGSDKFSLLLLPTEAVIAAGSFLLFSESKPALSRYAWLLLCGGIANGLSGIILPFIEISPAFFVAAFLSMTICYCEDITIASLSCAILGFISYFNSENCISMTGFFMVCAFFASVLSGFGKFGTGVGFLCGLTVCCLFSGNLYGMTLSDIFIPVAVYCILPEGLYNLINDKMSAKFKDDSLSVGAVISERLKILASAICRLSEGITLSSNRQNLAKSEISDMITSRVCSGCPQKNVCFSGGSAIKNMNELWQIMDSDGFCNFSNLPNSFLKNCVKYEKFLSEFNHAYELFKQNTLYLGETNEGCSIMAHQYGEISNLINIMSEEICNDTIIYDTPKIRYHADIFVCQEAKDGQVVCGDTLIHFEYGNKFYVILSDGMGFGENALSESRLTARLFEEFLKADFDKKTAARMINSALSLKAESESFSTVDLLEINLSNGDAEFLKIGSAQSFIKNADGISVITSKSLPVGILDKIEISPEKVSLKSGDTILMMSDGIGEAGRGVLKNDWIKKLLLLGNRSEDELVRSITQGAKSRMQFSDDITCVLIKLKKGRN